MLAATRAYGDGREALSLNFAQSASLFHTLQLLHGVVSWATRGVFLGERHAYIGVQVDDLFLPDDIYTGGTFRMSASDLQAALDYQNAKRAQTVTGGHALPLGLQRRGRERQRRADGHGAAARERLQLDQPHLRPLRSRRADPQPSRSTEFNNNINVANQFGLRPFSVTNLVNPGYTGLTTAAVMQAMFDAGIRYDRRRHLGAGVRQPVAQRRHLQPAAAADPDDPAAPDQPLLQRVDARPVDGRVQRHLPVVLGARSQLRRDPRPRERRARAVPAQGRERSLDVPPARSAHLRLGAEPARRSARSDVHEVRAAG